MMRKSAFFRNLAFTGVVVAVLIIGGGAARIGGEVEGGQTTSFSRSDWIARNMNLVRFSGGVLPVLNPLPAPETPSPGTLSLGFAQPVRVSSDLIPIDALAQPGTQAEPYLHSNPTDPNDLLAGWQENRFLNGGARCLSYGVSFDGGETWAAALLPNLTVVNGGPWQKASDPWVAFGPDGRAYYCSLLFNQTTPDNAIGVSVSTDGGLSWSSPVEVFRAGLDFNDKESITVDTSPASPFFGNVYATWDVNIAFATGQVSAQRLVIARSTDGGATYGEPVVVRNKGQNVGVIPRVGPDGTVYLVWSGGPLNAKKLKLFFSKSHDGGLTWTPKKKIGKIRSSGVGALRVGGDLASFAVDPVTGELHVARAERRLTGVDQAVLITSRDGGETWSEDARVSDAPDNASVFTVSVAADGKQGVAVSYYSVQNDPALHFLVDHYVRISRDGGRTFQPSLRVTPSSFDIRFASQTTGAFFLGDYAGLTGTSQGFHMLWVATHPGAGAGTAFEPDVFTSSTP